MGRKYEWAATVRDPETRTSSIATGEIDVAPTPTSRSDAEAAAGAIAGRENPGRNVTSVRAWRSGS